MLNSLPLHSFAEVAEEPESAEKMIWHGEFFENHEFHGEPVRQEFDSIDFSWEKDGPIKDSESQVFSAILTSEINIDNSQTVELAGNVQGEMVLYLNNEVIYKYDGSSDGALKQEVSIPEGLNNFKIEYKSSLENAQLKLDFIVKDEIVESDELPTDKWLAHYFSSIDLTGEKHEELVENLKFDDFNSFSSNIPLEESFSASYAKSYVVTEQTDYVLSGTVQGGIRFYVNGKLEFEDWTNGIHEVNRPVTLDEGTHQIIVEYKNDQEEKPALNLIFSEDVIELEDSIKETPIEEDSTENSKSEDTETPSNESEPVSGVEENITDSSKTIQPLLRRALMSTAVSADNWTAEFYPNLNFSGTPYISNHEKLDLSWGSGSPHTSIPNDGFSAIFKKNLNVSRSGFYRISGRSDDGIRVYIDDKLLINHWADGVNHFHKDILLTQGTHSIKVEYYDKKYSAAIRVDVTPMKELVDASWEAAYYPNANFNGNPIIKKINSLDLNWGSGSPDPKIPNDNFTATFQKKLVVNQSGEFLFEGRADDGIKVFIDDKEIINKWQDGVNHFSEKVSLSPGEYLVRAEYYDKKYGAAIRLDIRDQTVHSDAWTATYYPTKDFKGTPYSTTVRNLDLNWGSGSPAVGIPNDNFSAIFEKDITIAKSGTYLFSGRADDGVRVYVDGKMVINSWGTGVNPINHLVELTQGTHTIRVEYFDEKYSAAIRLDIDEFPILKDVWMATYYPTKDFTGTPVRRYEASNLDLNWGSGSPAAGIPNDNFSATFEKTISVPKAGTYQFTGRADDGIRVYVDGKMVINSWGTGVNPIDHLVDLTQGEHVIRVEYFDGKYSAAIKLDINELTRPNDAWLATYYPSANFTGLPVKRYEASNLDLNWGSKSPATSIPNDGFSGIFEKTITISETATYQLSGRADDGIRIFVNGKKELDLWKTGVNTFNKNIELPAGTHKIKVEYFDEKYGAAIKLDIAKAVKQVIYKKTNYSSTYTEALAKQMGTNPPPQTDKYRNQNAFIHKDHVKITRSGAITGDGVRLRTAPRFGDNISVTVNSGTKVTILGEVVGDLHAGSTKWYKISYDNKTLYVHHSLANPNAMVATTTARVNIRETANTNGHIFATLAAGTTVNIVKEGSTWHEIRYDAWRNAKQSDVEQYLNPNKFTIISKDYYQFLSLKGSTGISVAEVNNKILAGKGILAGKASAFSKAATTYNVNEIYLISHALLETGNGTSDLANGVLVSSVDGKPVTPKLVYNTYGVGAYDSCALKCGSEYAYTMGWFTPEAAIIGGAQFISKNYVSVGQDTLYKMKWNPSAPGTHQYATDIGWAVKQTTRIFDLYSVLDTYTITFDVPVYR